MEHSSGMGQRPGHIHVISTPIPSTRLLAGLAQRLRDCYAALLAEPLPDEMQDLLRRFERAPR